MVVVEVTESIGLEVLEKFKHTLFLHLAHSGISGVEVLVTICWNLVNFWLWTVELLRNFRWEDRIQPPPPYIIS